MTKRQSKKRELENEAKPKETKVEFLASLAGVLATGLFIITFMVQAFAIPSSSMENTLLVGDHVFVNRIQFAPETAWAKLAVPYDQIRRGDIVVFLSPQTPGLHVVKRIIGVPGDRSTYGTELCTVMVRSWTNPMYYMTATRPFMLTETIFRLICRRVSIPTSGRGGGAICHPSLRERTSSFHRTPTLEWEITEVLAWIVAFGVLSQEGTSLDGRCLYIGLLKPVRRSTWESHSATA